MKDSSGEKIRKRKILIVDDDEIFLREIQEAISAAGYDVNAFTDGESALRQSGNIQPDLIVLDLKMPVKSGFQLADEFRRMPDTTVTPIIAMTGYYTEEEYQLLIRICGLENLLTKPFDHCDLISKIETVLNGKRKG
jgi:DNA-binding response OmpR family regulator